MNTKDRRQPLIAMLADRNEIRTMVVGGTVVVDDEFTTWKAPEPNARAAYFAAQGLPLPDGCGPDGRAA